MFTLNQDGESYCVNGSTLTIGEDAITLPETYREKPVTAVGDSAFARHKMKSVSLPNTVVSIGESAFYECTELTSVTVPEKATEILTGAFYGCSSLISVHLPEGLLRLEEQAFCGGERLEKISLPDSLQFVGGSAFEDCNITYNVFETGCYLGSSQNKYMVLIGTENNQLVACTVHASTKIVAAGAFVDCALLTSVTFPRSVKRIGNYAFVVCPAVSEIVYEGTAEEWNKVEKDEYWFGELTGLTVRCSDASVPINE